MAAQLMILRIAPLLASTSCVTYTIAEDLYLRPFGNFRPDLRVEANRIIPEYKDRWFPPSLAVIFTVYPVAICTAIANVWVNGNMEVSGEPNDIRYLGSCFYIAGALFSALHFAFGPRDLSILKQINEKEKDNGKAMADWVHMNLVRGLMAELPSWLCFFVGFIAATTGL
ncbi:hypothetical protein F4808DRAFT_295144 [Astrocystis sublimbata]|nr:hypothetical protein F4808DRAFT_295144 [Astrocystis sublimbata]